MKVRKEVLAENVVLYCGDCREVIPTLDLKGACVVSDPPYGMQETVGNIGYGRKQSQKSGLTDAHIHNDQNLDVVGEVMTLVQKQFAKKPAWIVAFYSARMSPSFFETMNMFDYFGEIIWDKKAPALGGQIRYQHENIAFFKNGKPEQINDCLSVLTYAALKGDNRSTHPHEKPDRVMDILVGAVPGRTILDPFMGTGSTGAAAVRARRGFVGIELEPKYFEIAIKKVGAALKQPENFWE